MSILLRERLQHRALVLTEPRHHLELGLALELPELELKRIMIRSNDLLN